MALYFGTDSSQDGLGEEDIHDYENAVKYLQETKKLKEHLDSNLESSESRVGNMNSELWRRISAVADVDFV